MPLIFRLKSIAIAPAIWLTRNEWQQRFKADDGARMELLEALDPDDFGGLPAIVDSVSFTDTREHKLCIECGIVKPIAEFSPTYDHKHATIRTRAECKCCGVARVRRRTRRERPTG